MAPRKPKDPEAKPAPKAAPKLAGSKPAAKARPDKPTLKVVEKPQAPARPSVLKLKDLVEQVAGATGTKKPEAKKAVEATLAAIQSALDAGAGLALPPLGKLRVAKAAGSVMTLKLRKAAGEKPGANPLAEDGEDD